MFQFSVISYTFPVHVATATSHFVLAIMALTRYGRSYSHGTFTHGCTEPLLWQLALLWEVQFGAIFHKVFAGLGLFAALLSPYC